LNIITRDIDISWKFYHQILGADYLYHISKNKIAAKIIDFDFYIEEDENWEKLDSRIHFGLRTSREGVFEWKRHLLRNNIPLVKGNNPTADLYEEPDSKRIALYFCDPDELTIEIYCPEQ
jgi:catechol 2,3-dioxygenase-like lactoylglutathione lyase family enzyme